MKKEGSFFKGALILSMAGVIVKVLGALYRIPIGNIIKSEGMGYYSTAHPFYALMLTIATAGFPVAIAKLVSEKRGFFQGRSNMVPTAISQIGEQLLRVISGLFLTVYLLDRGIPIAAGELHFQVR